MTERTRIAVPAAEPPAAVTMKLSSGVEVIRIAADGRLFWRQREVDTDADFRAAMLDLAGALRGAQR